MVDLSRRGFLLTAGAGVAAYFARPLFQAAEVFAQSEPETGVRYAILVRADTQKQKAWGRIVGTLGNKYPGARVVAFRDNIEEARDELAEEIPTHVAYVAKPEELLIPTLPTDVGEFDAERERQIGESSGAGRFSRLLSDLDGSGYSACIRGVVTGMVPEDALRLAAAERLYVDNVLLKSSTDLFDSFGNGFAYSDGFQDYLDGKFIRRLERRGGEKKETKLSESGPDILEKLNSDDVKMVLTSWHATYRDWVPDMGRNDRFLIDREGGIFLVRPDGSAAGQIDTSNPKVWYGPGNCQLGRIKSRNESFALSLIRSGGVVQFLGYVIDTWHGAAGWPVRGHLLGTNTPTFAEANYMNTIGLQFAGRKLKKYREEHHVRSGEEEYGKQYDQHVFVLYGDPGLDARLRRDSSATPLMEKKAEVEKRGGKNIYRFSARALKTHSLEGSFPIFLISRGISPKNIRASRGLEYQIGPNFVLFDVGSQFVVEDAKSKLGYPPVPKGTEWSLEFTA